MKFLATIPIALLLTLRSFAAPPPVEPSEITVEEGESASFSVDVGGTNRVKIDWQKWSSGYNEWLDIEDPDDEIEGEHTVVEADDTDRVRTLTFPAVHPGQEGSYRASISTSLTQRSYTDPATLTVIALPLDTELYEFTNFAGKPGGAGTHNGIAGGLGSVSDVAFGPRGFLYIADTRLSVIKKLSPRGVLSTFAGSSLRFGHVDGDGLDARFNRPRGVVVDADGYVYVADSGNGSIRVISPQGEVDTLATGLTVPNHLVIAYGDLFVTADQEILRVTSDGTVSTFASTNSQLGDLAIDQGGGFLVTLLDGGTVAKVSPTGQVTPHISALAPTGVAVGHDGIIYFTQFSDSILSRHDPGAGETTAWLDLREGIDPTTYGWPMRGVVVAPFGDSWSGENRWNAGDLFVADDTMVHRIEPSGQISTHAGRARFLGTADGTGEDARFEDPYGLAFDANGDLIVADSGNHTIRRVTPDQVVTTIAGMAGQPGDVDGTGSDARLWMPELVVPKLDGNFIITHGDTTLRRMTPSGYVGPVGEQWVTSAGSFYGLVAGLESGTYFMTDGGNHVVKVRNPDGSVSVIAGRAGSRGTTDGLGIRRARFDRPLGMAIDIHGALYVADSNNHTIRKLTPGGPEYDVTTIAGMPGEDGHADGVGSEARFRYPRSLALDRRGNIFVLDGNLTVRKIKPDGEVFTVGGMPGRFGWGDGFGAQARFSALRDIVVAFDGTLYFTDGHRIVEGAPRAPRKVVGPVSGDVCQRLVGVDPEHIDCDLDIRSLQFDTTPSSKSASIRIPAKHTGVYQIEYSSDLVRWLPYWGPERAAAGSTEINVTGLSIPNRLRGFVRVTSGLPLPRD